MDPSPGSRWQNHLTIDPKPLTPWKSPSFVEIDIEPDREKAKDKATAIQAPSNMVVFSDASGQNSHLGAAAVMLDHNQEVLESRQLSVGSMGSWSVYAAELIGVFYAISLVLKVSSLRLRAPATPGQEPSVMPLQSPVLHLGCYRFAYHPPYLSYLETSCQHT